jgi:hypothetical protein
MWTVTYTRSACKGIEKLPYDIKEITYLLISELKLCGPYRSNWRNYGKLTGQFSNFHCHLNSGRPRYVACWIIVDKKTKFIEVYYVGTHEKAPY